MRNSVIRQNLMPATSRSNGNVSLRSQDVASSFAQFEPVRRAKQEQSKILKEAQSIIEQCCRTYVKAGIAGVVVGVIKLTYHVPNTDGVLPSRYPRHTTANNTAR